MSSKKEHEYIELSSFSARFRSLKRKGETNRELAYRLGIHYNSVRAYMNGQLPKGDMLLRIADNSDVNLHWLLTGEGSRYVLEEPPIVHENGKVLRITAKTSRRIADYEWVELACDNLDNVEGLDKETKDVIKDLIRILERDPEIGSMILEYFQFLEFREKAKKGRKA